MFKFIGRLFQFNYIKNLLQPDSKDSIKSFSMFLSTVLGFILGLMLGVSVMIDAWDGKIDTDLYGASTYVISIGALVTLSSIPKIMLDREKIRKDSKKKVDEETME